MNITNLIKPFMSELKSPLEITNKDEISNRNVAIFFNSAASSPPIELSAAMTRDLLSRGNRVTVYVCDRSFKSTMDNPFNRLSMYNFMMFRAKDAIKGLNVPFKVINLNTALDTVSPETEQTLDTAVMSSFASLFKAQTKNDLTPPWLAAYNNMFRSAKKLYNFFVQEIKKEGYEFVFMFNGRFGDVRPVLEAARSSGVGYGLYEMKKSINEIVFVNELVHSIGGNTRRAIEFYEADKKQGEENARQFFKRKTENKETGDPIYTKSQKQGSLPDAVVDTTKKVIAIYPTTDDEYKFIGKEWDGFVPESQIDEIEKLITNLPEKDYLVVIKMHPNQANMTRDAIARYLNLTKKYPHIVVEPPQSEKDTYALMNRSDVVVTFASTIGVEACYAGKPVVLIGDTNWGKMNVAHQTYSGTEAAELIKKGIEPKPIEGAIIWGSYSLSYKDPLPSFKVAGKGDFYVDGRRIGKSTLLRILQLPAKLELNMKRPGFSFGTHFFLKIIDTIINLFKGTWAAK